MHLNLSHSIDELNDRHDEFEGDVSEDIKELQEFVKKLGMLIYPFIHCSLFTLIILLSEQSDH